MAAALSLQGDCFKHQGYPGVGIAVRTRPFSFPVIALRAGSGLIRLLHPLTPRDGVRLNVLLNGQSFRP